MMTKVSLFCVIAVVVIVGALAWHHSLSVPAGGASGEPSVTSAQSPTAASSSSKAANASLQRSLSHYPSSGQNRSRNGGSYPGTVVSAERARIAAMYACSTCDDDDPFAAQSAAEAAWMQTRGFPTQQQLQNMWSLDRDTLRELSDQGVLAATGLLGTMLLKEGRTSEGLSYLGKARQHGSIYALYSWSDWLRSRENPHANKYLAAAYIRLAYLMGDTNAAAYLYSTVPDMDRYALARIDRRASMIFRRLQKMHLQKFGTPLQTLTRPSPDEDRYLWKNQ